MPLNKQCRFLLILFITCISAFPNFSNNTRVRLFNISDSIEFDTIPYMVNDSYFTNSYLELCKMFDGAMPYDLKKAEFLIENAYYGGSINYNDFCHDIDSIVFVLNRFIDVNNIRQYKTAPNFAIFEYFTKPSIMNNNCRFSYDFENPLGKGDFSVYFISRLIRTHKGQCTSMPLLYKILCDELGGKSSLAFAPMHLYIKHIDEEGNWVNVELTHGGFVRDIWIMEQLKISSEAIRNGIFLCAINDQETIGFMMFLLAKAYIDKYESYDYFVELCVNKILNSLPNFCNALVLKYNMLQNRAKYYFSKNLSGNSQFIINTYIEFQNTLTKLDSLGYSQPSPSENMKAFQDGKKQFEKNIQK